MKTPTEKVIDELLGTNCFQCQFFPEPFKVHCKKGFSIAMRKRGLSFCNTTKGFKRKPYVQTTTEKNS